MSIYDLLMFGRKTAPFVILSNSMLAVGADLAAINAEMDERTPTSFPTLVQFALPVEATATKMLFHHGTSVSNNIDLGIYDEALNLLVSTGSQARTGAGTMEEFDITDTVLPAGRYYMAMQLQNATSDGMVGFAGNPPSSAFSTSVAGAYFGVSAFPLPDPGIISGGIGIVPLMGVVFTANVVT